MRLLPHDSISKLMGILTSAQKATQCPFLGIGHKVLTSQCVCVCKHVESCCCPCGLHNLGGAETLRWIYPICIFFALSKSRFIVDKDCVTRCTGTKTEVMERTAKTHRTHSKKTLRWWIYDIGINTRIWDLQRMCDSGIRLSTKKTQ